MQTDRAKPHGSGPYFDCEADATLARSVEPESDAFPFDNARALDPRPPAFTDEALALRFAEIHANGLRYVERWGRWLSYDGVRWRFDDTLLAFDRARKICRQASVECNDPRVAKALASASTVAGVIKLSPADRRLAASVDQWDSDPWVLNTPGGVVDLRTGESRPHQAGDYMTKVTAVTPDFSCPTPTWSKFLDRVTDGDKALIGFLQRMAGYALTGITHEHPLFFLYGTGANGKSTFLNALCSCIGDYHRSAPMDAFTESKYERHPTDLAGLRGARLVTAVETEEGRLWAESRIKALTGGDKIAARFMRQDFFEFTPQFKLLIAGNHRPNFRSIDEAIRRRLHLVPFIITIPLAERDVELLDKLKNELIGILAWMIQGCLDWQKQALRRPRPLNPQRGLISKQKMPTPRGWPNAASEIPTHGKAPPTSSPAGQRGLKKPASPSALKSDSRNGLKRAV